MSSDTQTPPALSNEFARLECELNEFQSAIQAPEAPAAALATVDQDMVEAGKRLTFSMVTPRHIMHAPISILPVEILAGIFHIIVFSALRHHCPGWVYVTHVCRRWRQIALDDTTLWTHFSDHSGCEPKDRIAEQLCRARNAPLVIEHFSWSRAGRDRFALFIPHIFHTRELYLHNIYPEIVQEISIQKAPALERLELNLRPISIEYPARHSSFFKGRLPKLRILCLGQIVFPWSTVPRGQLTQLKVHLSLEVFIMTSKDSQYDDLDQLIGLLVDSPSLEVLTLYNCLPAVLSESSGGQTIHLPRLSCLRLGGSSSRVTNLLKMLKLSSSTTLDLNCTPENTAIHKDYHILPFLSAHFNGPTPVQFQRFKIDLSYFSGYRIIEMVASTSLPKSPIPHVHVIQADELSLTFNDVAKRTGADILRRTCDVLSLANLEYLSLTSIGRNQFINWSEIFQHCTKVTTVEVYEHETIELLQALTPPKRANTTTRGKRRRERKCGDNGRGAQAQAPNEDESHGPAPVQVPIFPKLACLSLISLDFQTVVPGSGVLFNVVLNAVRRRKVNKTPLTTLRIHDCDGITKNQAKVLEKVVPDFQWDPDEGYYDEEEGDREDYHSSELDDCDDDYSDIGDQSMRQEEAHVSLAQAE